MGSVMICTVFSPLAEATGGSRDNTCALQDRILDTVKNEGANLKNRLAPQLSTLPNNELTGLTLLVFREFECQIRDTYTT